MSFQSAALQISLPSAQLITDSYGKEHIVFMILVQGGGLNHKVQKKFSDFRTFDAVWRPKYPQVTYQLPPKVFFKNRSDRVVTERRFSLQAYLNGLLGVSSLLPYLANFLAIDMNVLKSAKEGTLAKPEVPQAQPQVPTQPTPAQVPLQQPAQPVAAPAPLPPAATAKPSAAAAAPEPAPLPAANVTAPSPGTVPANVPAPSPAQDEGAPPPPPAGSPPAPQAAAPAPPKPLSVNQLLEQEQAALAAAQAQTVAIAARLAATRKAAEEEKREKERREAEQRELERQALLLAAREQERRANDEVEEARKAFEAAQLRASAARRASLTAAGEPAVAAVSGGPAGVAPSKPVHGVKPSDIKASLKNNESAEAGAPKLTARVAAAYTAQDGTQLSLRESEVIEVLDSSDPAGRGWWYGRNTDGTEGYFPRDFVNSLPA